jgi:hypothetical protein
MLPEKIYNQIITKNQSKRYEEITKIMINEYGYSIKETYIDKEGLTVWRLVKTIQTENNFNMEETYEIGGIPSGQELLKLTFDAILPKLN